MVHGVTHQVTAVDGPVLFLAVDAGLSGADMTPAAMCRARAHQGAGDLEAMRCMNAAATFVVRPGNFVSASAR